ncbi:MAG: hypothetical protein ACXW0Z_18265 [Gemmatirosa sp.]
MSNRDWDKELAEIDRRLGSAPDEPPAPAARPAPLPATPPAAQSAPAAPGRRVGTPGDVVGRRAMRTQVALLARLAFGAAVVAALVYWPYPARCGLGLSYYLALVSVLGLAGLATSVASWRHRAPLVHLLGILMIAAAGLLGAREVLPKLGYAFPTPEHPASWSCG